MSVLNKRNVIYNGYDLEDIAYLTITRSTAYAPPNRRLNSNAIGNNDGSSISGAYYTNKIITISCSIIAPTRAMMEDSLTDLGFKLQSQEQTLSVSQSGSTREYIATHSGMDISNESGSYCEVNINFDCSDPMGYESTYTTFLTVTSLTNNNQSYVVSIDGKAIQLPKITITIDSLTGSSAELSLSNSTRGETLTISRAWSANDVIVIDAENGEVTVNDVLVEFNGAIPKLNVGDNTLVYDDDFTARSVDIDGIYRKRYL